MKIQTGNRLAHYQVEHNELTERAVFINAQITSMTRIVEAEKQYLSYNNGDKRAREEHRNNTTKLRSLLSEYARIQKRLITLEHQMRVESNKVVNGR